MLKIFIHVQANLYQPKSQKAQNKKRFFFFLGLGDIYSIILYYSNKLYYTISETDSGKEFKSLYVYKKTTCFVALPLH